MVQSANDVHLGLHIPSHQRAIFLPLSRLIPQTFAGKEAVHCKGGCSALRERLQCTASEMVLSYGK